MVTLGTIIIALVVVLVLAAWWSWKQTQKPFILCGEMIPGPKPLPLLGNAYDIGLNPKKFIPIGLELMKKYTTDVLMLRFWLGPILFIAMGEPEDVELILTSTKNITKSFQYDFLQPWLGLGLLTSTGERWRKHRKIITPTFHFKILEEFNSVFNAQGDTLMGILRDKVGKGFFDITTLINGYTQDVICETAMGINVNAQQGGSSAYLGAVKNQCEILAVRTSQPWYFPDFIFNLSSWGRQQKRNLKIMHEFTDKVIAHRKKILAENTQNQAEALRTDEMGIKRRLAFLDYLLLSSGGGTVLTDQDIREEVETFMFEGHDTTSAAINFAIYELSKRPKLQEELFQEMLAVSGDCSDETRFSSEIFGELKLLDRVIKETLRLYPSVPIFTRKIEQPVRLKAIDVELPANVTVGITPLFMHKNPRMFPNPDEFNPDHFLPERVEKRHHFAYVPFSAGSRNCIGQKFAMLEMKSVLSKIIWNFQLELEKGFEPDVVMEITMKSWNGIRVSVSPRAQ